MMTAAEDWESRANGPEMPPCECGHQAHQEPCAEMMDILSTDFEGEATQECDCTVYRPVTAEDQEEERPRGGAVRHDS